MGLKLVLFDLGGVVFKLNWQASFEKLNCPIGFNQALEIVTHSQALDQFEKGLISPFAFYENLKTLIKINIDYKAFTKAWNRVIEGPVEGIENLLLEFKGKLPIMALTNTNILHYDKLWQIIDPNHFDHIFASHLMSKRKPEDDIYHEVLNQTGFNSEQVLFIDDTALNIETAQRLNFKTLLNFNNPQQIRKELISYLDL
ncbi:MAG: HAD-IA family hydrolase [Bacteriovoracaceae bacterium]